MQIRKKTSAKLFGRSSQGFDNQRSIDGLRVKYCVSYPISVSIGVHSITRDGVSKIPSMTQLCPSPIVAILTKLRQLFVVQSFQDPNMDGTAGIWW